MTDGVGRPIALGHKSHRPAFGPRSSRLRLAALWSISQRAGRSECDGSTRQFCPKPPIPASERALASPPPVLPPLFHPAIILGLDEISGRCYLTRFQTTGCANPRGLRRSVLSGHFEEYELVKLTLRDRETAQEAVRRFRKLVERSGIKKEIRIREFYEKPSETKRRARLRAARRARRERLLGR